MSDHCKNCNTVLRGKFCHVCGQKVAIKEEQTLNHLLREVLHFFTHIDSKFFKTLKNILFRPGTVTKDFSEGITIRHYKLSSLYIIITLLYFLLPGKLIGYQFINVPLEPQLQSGI